MVMLPDGTPDGIPELTPDAPTVGSAARGSTDHPPAVDAGHDGIEAVEVAAYCEEGTPVGLTAAH